MGTTLYFAKLNLASEEIYKIYKDPQKRIELKLALSESLRQECHWDKESFFIGDDGIPVSQKVEYQLRTLSIDEDMSYAEGWLYKKSILRYNSLLEETKELVPKSVENTEAIRFYFDLEHELIGYNTTNRFGYKEFLEAFVHVINLGLDSFKPEMYFTISLCSKGIGLDDIKEALGEIGKIKELQFRIQPPNPAQELLDHLQELGESRLENMDQANVTRMDVTFQSTGESGLNLDSALIDEELNKLQGIHQALSPEEANKNGYIKVTAVSKTGRKFSSEEAKPFKKVINDLLSDFKDACKDAFTELLS